MVRVIMHGCNGHMGQVITGLIKEDPDIEIVAGIDLVDNRDKERESPWDRLLLIYNGSRKKQKYLLPEENWEILVDAESSTRWKQREPAGKTAFAEPLSVLVLGHRKTRAAEEKETMAEKETA